MSARTDGGSVFPLQDPQAIYAFAHAAIVDVTDSAERDRLFILARAEAIGGLSVRDYFAALAMQAAATNPGADGFTFDERANWAYQQADAMLEARKA